MSAHVAGKPTLTHWMEYSALRAVTTLLRPLGWRGASAVGAFVGGLGWWPFAIRADRVARAIRACFPELEEREVARIARESYRGLGRVAIESAVLSRLSREALLGAFVEPEGWEHVQQAYDAGRGLVLVAGHIGSWELSAAYLAMRGVKIDAIARHMANPLSDGFFTRTRERFGVTVIFDDEAVRKIPRAFKDGHAVGFLSDQGAKGLASTFVPFFGRPARTPRGAAVFALRNDLPMLFIAAIRQPDGRYRFHAEPVEVARTGDKEQDIDATVRRYTRMLESWVRRHPEQYFWQHRRWRRQPEGTPPELGEP